MLPSTEDGLELEADANLLGSDLGPVPATKRTTTRWDIALLWVGMVVNVPSYYLAGSLVDLDMSWWQGVATIVLRNTILLAPLILTAHPGPRYGISFPVLLRSSFGVRGAHLPALLRALVACGWCGIETLIGGQAIFLLLPLSLKSSWYAHPIRWLGTSALEFSCFVLFLLLQLAILWKGMAGVRVLEKYSAPCSSCSPVLALWLGLPQSRRLRRNALHSLPPQPVAILVRLPPFPHREYQQLVRRRPQHAGLHAVCHQPVRSDRRPAGPPHLHGSVHLHRPGHHFLHTCDIRSLDLQPN